MEEGGQRRGKPPAAAGGDASQGSCRPNPNHKGGGDGKVRGRLGDEDHGVGGATGEMNESVSNIPNGMASNFSKCCPAEKSNPGVSVRFVSEKKSFS